MELQGLSDEDLIAVLSYLRSLAPVPSAFQRRQVNIFGRLLMSLFVKARAHPRRGELRLRSPQPWGSATADFMFGAGWKLP